MVDFIKDQSLYPDQKMLIYVGQIVGPELSETDFRISVAGNRFQLKLIEALTPDVFINIVPHFLVSSQCAQGLVSTELFLDARGPGPRLTRILGKTIGDAMQFLQFLLFKKKLTFVFYNLDYSNVMLALLSRLFGNKVFVVAADYVSPATNGFEAFLLRVYKLMSGVILLRANTHLNRNSMLLPAIIDVFPESPGVERLKPNVLYSGSLGETTGLYIALQVAVACPHIRFYFSGRPFHISEHMLAELITIAKAEGADIEYLGMIPFKYYQEILSRTSIALSLRNPDNPDHNNNFPSKIAEYMSAGKVVISSLQYPELAEHTYIYAPYNSNCIADILNAIIMDDDYRNIISKNAKKFSNENFSPNVVRNKLMDFIQYG